ncbi:MAG: hypothetical protein NTZ78_15320 [Candidatus Aureabacteria bacterium]|nr:hypothetical protein [Candidatus Auribacterota bacterium]
MKKLITVALSLMFVVCMSYTTIAGSLDSPGAPSAGSGMYTLQNLYDYLTSGTALTVQTSFQEPMTGPTAGTMKTTKQIGDDMDALFNQCNVTTAAEVKSGYKFFCTQSGSWGVQTGTLVVPPTATPTSTPTITPTITPTQVPWDAAACAEKGGMWSAKNDGSGLSGCWTLATCRTSCNSFCGSLGLSCDPANYNDTGCIVGMALEPTSYCHSNASVDGGNGTPMVRDAYACGGAAPYVLRRGGTTQCAVQAQQSSDRRLCICYR